MRVECCAFLGRWTGAVGGYKDAGAIMAPWGPRGILLLLGASWSLLENPGGHLWPSMLLVTGAQCSCTEGTVSLQEPFGCPMYSKMHLGACGAIFTVEPSGHLFFGYSLFKGDWPISDSPDGLWSTSLGIAELAYKIHHIFKGWKTVD